MTKQPRPGPNSGDPRRSTGDYRVGKYRPPVETRWKPGQSGNPKGRRKGRKNNSTILREILDRKLKVPLNGRVRSVSVRELILTRFAEAALKGDIKCASFLLQRDDATEAGHSPERSGSSSNDREIIEAFLKSHLNKDNHNGRDS